MTRVQFSAPDMPAGEVQEVDIRIGQSVMEVAVRAGVPGIVAECGGAMSCGTCHVYVSDADGALFEEQDASELDMLCEIEGNTARSRLSCQMILETAGDVVNIEVAAFNE